MVYWGAEGRHDVIKFLMLVTVPNSPRRAFCAQSDLYRLLCSSARTEFAQGPVLPSSSLGSICCSVGFIGETKPFIISEVSERLIHLIFKYLQGVH